MFVSNIPSIRVKSDYLETNAKCHGSVFSAFAELIDNAYDAQANRLFINHIKIKGIDCIVLKDDGNGLEKKDLIKMMSFGFSLKRVRDPIGQYGNGFKSGSMRIGDDVLIFSKTLSGSCSVGFLSKTYNKDRETIQIPAFSWIKNDDENFETIDDTDIYSIDEIIENCKVFKLQKDFQDIFSSHYQAENRKNNFGFDQQTQGTIVLIYNLKQIDYKYELEFNKNDIQLSQNDDSESVEETKDYFSSFYSLRKCLASLYLSSNKSIQFDNKSNLIIKIGQKDIECIYETEIKNIRSLDFEVNDHKVTMYVGEKKSSESFKDTCTYIYYKNRLIETVDKKKTKGKCSDKNISILQANFLTPKHNKREFEKNEEYKKLRRQINEKNNKYMENYKDALKNKAAKAKTRRNQDEHNSRESIDERSSNSIENDVNDNNDILIQNINQPQNILPLNININEGDSNYSEIIHNDEDIQIDSSKQAEEQVDLSNNSRRSARLNKKVKNFIASDESDEENSKIRKKSNSQAKRKSSQDLEQFDETILPSTSKLQKKKWFD